MVKLQTSQVFWCSDDEAHRILIAQALAEGLTLATKEAVLARYGIPVVWD